MNGTDIILTGIPRSGTTLTCHLLNRVPQTVALAEPMDLSQFRAKRSRADIMEAVGKFFADSRASLLAEGKARTKHHEGQVPDNTVAGRQGGEFRVQIADKGEIAFDKPLEPGFTLAVKHPSAFTSLLPDLREQFPCFALVRNPLSVLTSWNSVTMSVQRGHAPAAEKFDQELARSLDRIKDRVERQLFLLSWFYERYAQNLAPERVIRYEDMVATGGRALQVIVPAAAELSEPLENKNKNKLYDAEMMQELGKRLLQSEGSYWKFYTRESVEALLG